MEGSRDRHKPRSRRLGQGGQVLSFLVHQRLPVVAWFRRGRRHRRQLARHNRHGLRMGWHLRQLAHHSHHGLRMEQRHQNTHHTFSGLRLRPLMFLLRSSTAIPGLLNPRGRRRSHPHLRCLLKRLLRPTSVFRGSVCKRSQRRCQ